MFVISGLPGHNQDMHRTLEEAALFPNRWLPTLIPLQMLPRKLQLQRKTLPLLLLCRALTECKGPHRAKNQMLQQQTTPNNSAKLKAQEETHLLHPCMANLTNCHQTVLPQHGLKKILPAKQWQASIRGMLRNPSWKTRISCMQHAQLATTDGSLKVSRKHYLSRRRHLQVAS